MTKTEKLLIQRTFTDSDQNIIPHDGSPLHWRVSVYAIVIKDDQILLGKNRHEILYDIPGGGVDLGEDLEQALQREAIEETGTPLKIGKLLHTENGWFYHKREKKYYQTLQIFYEAEAVGETCAATDPDTEWCGWVPLTEIGITYRLPTVCEQLLRQLRPELLLSDHHQE